MINDNNVFTEKVESIDFFLFIFFFLIFKEMITVCAIDDQAVLDPYQSWDVEGNSNFKALTLIKKNVKVIIERLKTMSHDRKITNYVN